MPIGDDTFAYRRDLPHLQKAGKTYFVTFCTKNRLILDDQSRDIALDCCVRDHRTAYWLHCVCVMPDHVHVIFTPYEDYSLAKIMNRVKGVSAHEINRALVRQGPVWQREYFDRVIRSTEDLQHKIEYVCENPVRAGLVQSVDDYPWIWRQWVDDAISAPPRAAAPH